MKPPISLDPLELIIFDADGTLRKTTDNQKPAPNKPGEWELMKNVVPIMRHIRDHALNERDGDFSLGVASNQGGVSAGYLSFDEARGLLHDMLLEIFGGNWPKTHIYFCPTMDKDDPFRKPNPGMLKAILEKSGADPYRALMVGDREEDAGAASAADIRFMNADDFFLRS